MPLDFRKLSSKQIQDWQEDSGVIYCLPVFGSRILPVRSVMFSLSGSCVVFLGTSLSILTHASTPASQACSFARVHHANATPES